MRSVRPAAIAVLAFLLGLAAAHLSSAARAAAAPLEPAVIDLAAIVPDAMPTPTAVFPNLRSKLLVATDGMTASLTMGTVAKHVHANANEVQVVLAGTGTEWLGDRQIELKPGVLVVIPQGTVHGGLTQTSGSLRFVAIKTPPQDPTDVHFVP